MKYCKSCKLLAGDSETQCRRCGQSIVDLGTRRKESPEPESVPPFQINGRMEELVATERRNIRNARLLMGLCAAFLLIGTYAAYQAYARTVLAYAVLDDVEISQDAFESNRINVAFRVVRPGKVAFDRTSGVMRTSKIDVFNEPGPVELSWAWPSPESIDFSVLYRSGLLRSSEKSSFAVDDDYGRAVDIVFLIDTTSSMQPFIDTLKHKCTDFADIVKREGHDCRLGFVSFGDLALNEPIEVFEPTEDVLDFKSSVGGLEARGGGDEPESSVEALRRALGINFRDSARPCLVHVTDAACHHQEQLPDLAKQLQKNSVITYVVSLDENTNLYSRLCSHGGKFLSMENADFDGILDFVARALVSEIRYQEQTI